MRTIILFLLLLSLSSCKRVELPTACDALPSFVESQRSRVQAMQELFNQQGKGSFLSIANSAAELQKEQDAILDSCAASVIARGGGCLEFHLIGDIRDLRMHMKAIHEVGSSDSGISTEAVMVRMLKLASESGSRNHGRGTCKP